MKALLVVAAMEPGGLQHAQRAYQRLVELHARRDLTEEQRGGELRRIESEHGKVLGWMPAPGHNSLERIAARLKTFGPNAFGAAANKGLLRLDGAPMPLASSSPPAKPSSAFVEGLREARADLQLYMESVRGKHVAHVNPFGNGAVAGAGWAELSPGNKVVVRFGDEPALSVQLNNGSHVLARQFGLRRSTVPSAMGKAEDKNAMFMVHAPPGFEAANKVPERLAKIPELARVLGALHDLLTSQDDRMPKNLMVNEQGEYVLIDPDWSWGNFNPWGWSRSLFYPGGEAGLKKGSQTSFDALPQRARETLQGILDASVSVKDLAEAYGVSPERALRLRENAELVRQKGLEGAIAETMGRRGRMYSTFQRHRAESFPQSRYGTSARVGKQASDYMAFGPYQPYPKGPVDVDFELRLLRDVDGETPVATLDIYNKTTEQPLSTRVVKAKDLAKGGQWTHLPLSADLPEGNNMEFRVHWDGRADVDLGWISADTVRAFGALERHAEGGFGREGDVTTARQGQQHPGYMVYGPYKPFPQKHAEVDFPLRLKRPVDLETEVATIDIYNKTTESPLATRVIRGKDLDTSGWAKLRLGADLPAGNNMEFRVRWNGNSDLDVGRISVR
jgi:hypothetical protein